MKEVAQNRDDNYNRDEDRHYENNFRKEYESKRLHPNDKDEFTNDPYRRDYDRERESNFSGKGLVHKLICVVLRKMKFRSKIRNIGFLFCPVLSLKET